VTKRFQTAWGGLDPCFGGVLAIFALILGDRQEDLQDPSKRFKNPCSERQAEVHGTPLKGGARLSPSNLEELQNPGGRA
jgi:hypothetical protein